MNSDVLACRPSEHLRRPPGRHTRKMRETFARWRQCGNTSLYANKKSDALRLRAAPPCLKEMPRPRSSRLSIRHRPCTASRRVSASQTEEGYRDQLIAVSTRTGWKPPKLEERLKVTVPGSRHDRLDALAAWRPGSPVCRQGNVARSETPGGLMTQFGYPCERAVVQIGSRRQEAGLRRPAPA